MKLDPIRRIADDRPESNGSSFITDREAEIGAKAVVNLFGKWGLSDAQACILLGGMSGATYSRWKRGEFGRINTDLRTRLSVLLGIHKALRILFTDNTRAYGWVKRSNETFAGDSALDIMLRGQITDLFRIRHYLDAVRG